MLPRHHKWGITSSQYWLFLSVSYRSVSIRTKINSLKGSCRCGQTHWGQTVDDIGNDYFSIWFNFMVIISAILIRISVPRKFIHSRCVVTIQLNLFTFPSVYLELNGRSVQLGFTTVEERYFTELLECDIFWAIVPYFSINMVTALELKTWTRRIGRLRNSSSISPTSFVY